MVSDSAPQKAKTDEFETNKILVISGGHFVHDTFSAFVSPLLPLLIDKLGLTLVLAGSLSVFTQVPSLLSVLIGYLADRVSVRYLVIFAPAVTATLVTLLGLMPTYASAAILLFSAGISVMAFHAPAPAMIAHISGRKVGRGMSLFMAGGELGRAVGPLLVGFGVTQWGMEGLWRLMIFGWLASVFLYFRLRHVSARDKGKRNTAKLDLKRFARVFAPLFGVMVFRNLIASGLSVFMVVFLTEFRGFELTVATGALALYELAGVGGALAGGTLSDRFGRRRTIGLAITLSAFFMFLFVNTTGALLVPVLIGLGLTTLSVTPIFQAVVQENLPENRATASGGFILYAFIIRAINVMVIGALGDALGLHTAFTVVLFLSLLALPSVWMLPVVENPTSSAGH